MATTISNTPASNSTDANFRSWGKGISDALTAIGLTKVSDAGQINWTTVLAPTLASTMQGYEMRQFTDALQSTSPFYIKIQYGSNGSNANNPGLQIQCGTGQDGAGNLTGAVSSNMILGCGTSSTTSFNSFFGGDNSYCTLIMWPGHTGSNNIPFGVAISRTKDNNGNATGSGINILGIGSTGSGGFQFQQYLPASGAAYPATAQTWFRCPSPQSGTNSYGLNVGYDPISPNIGYADNPDLGAILYFTGDVSGAGTVFSMSILGATHTFITLGLSHAAATSQNGNTSSKSLAFRYE